MYGVGGRGWVWCGVEGDGVGLGGVGWVWGWVRG